MDKNEINVSFNDNSFEENQNLLNDLNECHKKIEFLQKYRKTLIDFSDKCVCIKTFGLKFIVKSLEVDYKSVFNENESESQTVVEKSGSGEEIIIPNDNTNEKQTIDTKILVFKSSTDPQIITEKKSTKSKIKLVLRCPEPNCHYSTLFKFNLKQHSVEHQKQKHLKCDENSCSSEVTQNVSQRSDKQIIEKQNNFSVKTLESHSKLVFNENESKWQTVVERNDSKEEMIPNEDLIKDSNEFNQTEQISDQQIKYNQKSCEFVSTEEQLMSERVSTHIIKRRFKCRLCDKQFIDDLSQHMITDHNSYSCLKPDCKFTTISRQSLTRHMSAKHNERLKTFTHLSFEPIDDTLLEVNGKGLQIKDKDNGNDYNPEDHCLNTSDISEKNGTIRPKTKIVYYIKKPNNKKSVNIESNRCQSKSSVPQFFKIRETLSSSKPSIVTKPNIAIQSMTTPSVNSLVSITKPMPVMNVKSENKSIDSCVQTLVEGEDNSFKCNTCDKRFETLKSQRQVKVNDSQQKVNDSGLRSELPVYAPHMRTYKYDSTGRLKPAHVLAKQRLLRRLKLIRPCTWPGCDKKYEYPSKLREHMKLKHLNIIENKCEKCGKGFSSKCYLKRHLEMYHTKRQLVFKCDQCIRQFRSQNLLDNHKKSHLSEPQFLCEWPECGEKFWTLVALGMHKRIHTNGGHLICSFPECGKGFSTNNTLMTHESTHTKSITCNWPGCEERFAKESQLITHLKRHQNIREFKCEVKGCGHTFLKKSTLVLHMDRHRDPQPFKCEFSRCERRFSAKPTLNKHIKRVHHIYD